MTTGLVVLPGPTLRHAAASMRPLTLTPAHLRALRYAAAGYTAAETGRRVHLAEKTIKQHREEAARRLGARNLTHAVALALLDGLIDGSEPS